MSRAPEPTEWVALGVLGKARGLRGDVWFRSYNEASEAAAPGVTVRLTLRDGSQRKCAVAAAAVHGNERCLRFEGAGDRVSAEALVGATVALQRQDFPALEEGEYYHCDLPGVRVVDVSGREVGTVARVEAYPTVDALVVTTTDGEVEVPMTDAVLRSLDLAARVATVDLSAFEP